jgi:hypothetical protein
MEILTFLVILSGSRRISMGFPEPESASLNTTAL